MNRRFVIKIQKEHTGILALNILLTVFLITKMLRGLESSDAVGGLWNYIQLFFIVWGLSVALVRKSTVKNAKPVKILLGYSFIAFVFAILHIPRFTIGSLYSLAMILYPGLLLYVVYYCYKDKELTSNRLVIIAFYIIALLFLRTQFRYYNALTARATISNAYYVLALLPFVLLMTPEKIRLVPMSIAFVTLVFSAKRAGFIGLILGIVVYYFVLSIKRKNITSFLKYLIIAALVMFALYYATNIIDQRLNINFISRLLRTIDDGGSGRDVRWRTVIDAIRHSDALQIIFGHGNDSITTTIGNAHNDFLQVMYENGIIVLALYVSYFISLIKILVQMIRQNYEYAPEFGMSIVISLSLALFSFYIVEGTFITCGILTQGYILSKWESVNNKSIESGNERLV